MDYTDFANINLVNSIFIYVILKLKNILQYRQSPWKLKAFNRFSPNLIFKFVGS